MSRFAGTVQDLTELHRTARQDSTESQHARIFGTDIDFWRKWPDFHYSSILEKSYGYFLAGWLDAAHQAALFDRAAAAAGERRALARARGRDTTAARLLIVCGPGLVQKRAGEQHLSIVDANARGVGRVAVVVLGATLTHPPPPREVPPTGLKRRTLRHGGAPANSRRARTRREQVRKRTSDLDLSLRGWSPRLE